MRTPSLVVNLKTYRKGSKEKAVKLAKKCEKIANKTGKNIVLAVQNTDIFRLSKKVSLPIYAQHVDSERFGSNTGKDIPETLKYNGASGTLINHSEDQVTIEKIEKTVKRCRELSITSLVCVDSVEMAKKVDTFNPDFIAYEPPELIGGNISVSEAKPEVLKEVIEAVDTPVLTGAGVKTDKDVKKALEIGSKGVLVASGVVKADKQDEAVENLLKNL